VRPLRKGKEKRTRQFNYPILNGMAALSREDFSIFVKMAAAANFVFPKMEI